MDWDCTWSAFALYYLLLKLEKNVIITNCSKVPDDLKFLNIEDKITLNLDFSTFNPDLIITVDTPSIQQLREVYTNNENYFKILPVVAIDHHFWNENYASLNIVYPEIKSACEVVYNIIIELWLHSMIDEQIATFLILWMVTDTNNLSIPDLWKNFFTIFWDLIWFWWKHYEIVDKLFKQNTYDKARLEGYFMTNLKSNKDKSVVWNTLTTKEMQKFHCDWDDLKAIHDMMLKISTTQVSFILYEKIIEPWMIKWSFRTKLDEFNLSDFCKKWWGWWHQKASAFLVKWDLKEIEQEVLEELHKYFK